MAPTTIRSSPTLNHISNLTPSHCLPRSTFDSQQQLQFEIHPGKFVMYQYLLGPNNIPIAYTPTAGQCPDKPFPLPMRNSQTGETKTFSVRPFLTEYPARSEKVVFLSAAPTTIGRGSQVRVSVKRRSGDGTESSEKHGQHALHRSAQNFSSANITDSQSPNFLMHHLRHKSSPC